MRTWIVLLVVVSILAVLMTIDYRLARWFLIGGGLVVAAAFLATFLPTAVRERRSIGSLAIADTAGWVLAAFVLLALAAVAGVLGDWSVPATRLERIRGILTLSFIVSIIVLRTARWFSFVRARRGGPEPRHTHAAHSKQ